MTKARLRHLERLARLARGERPNLSPPRDRDVFVNARPWSEGGSSITLVTMTAHQWLLRHRRGMARRKRLTSRNP